MWKLRSFFLHSLPLLAPLLVFPIPAFAQQAQPGQSVGVVTALQGRATLAREALPQPVALKFKDDVFLRDQIATLERSTVRLLLGGRATVTIRELSQFTLEESVLPDGSQRSIFSLLAGKIGAAIARGLMRPGEAVEIRTPNAVAAVRGTVLIAEYIPPQGGSASQKPRLLASASPGPLVAQAPGAAGGISHFLVLSGQLILTIPGIPAITLGPLQAVTITAGPTGVQVGPPRTVSPAEAAQTSQGLQAGNPHLEEPDSSKTAQAQVAAALATQVLQATTAQAPPPAAPTPSDPLTDASVDVIQQPQLPPDISEDILEGSISNTTLVLGPGETLKTFSGTFNRTLSSPVIQITGSTVTQPGTDSLILAAPGASVTLAGPLLSVTDSSISGGGDLLQMTGGSLTGTGSGPLISIDPTTLTLGGSLLKEVDSSINSSGPLLQAVDSSVTTGGPMLDLTRSSLTGSGTTLDFVNSDVIVEGPVIALREGSSATLTGGPFIRMSGGSLTALRGMANSDGAGNRVNVNGMLLDATDAHITFGNLTIPSAGTIDTGVDTFSAPSGVPLIRLTNSTLTEPGTLIPVSDGTSTFAGLLLVASGSTITLGDLLEVCCDEHVTATSTAPLIQLTNSTVTSGSNLMEIVRYSSTATPPSSMTLAGPLLSDSGSTFDIAGSFLRVRDGARLTATTTSPLLQFSGSTVDMNGNIFNVGSLLGQSGSTVMLAGSLLNATTSALASGPVSNFISIADGATFTSGTTQPLLTVSGGSITTKGHLVRIGLDNAWMGTGSTATLVPTGSQEPVSVTLAGPLLKGTDANISALRSVLTVRDLGTFKSTTSEPLIQLGGNPGSTLTLGGTDPDTTSPFSGQQVGDQIFGVQPVLTRPSAASAELAGPILRAENSTISTRDRILAIFGTGVSTQGANATLTSTTAEPMFQFTGGSVTMSGTFAPTVSSAGRTESSSGSFLRMSSGDPTALATLNLSGPLLSSTGTTFSAKNHFVRFDSNAKVTSSGATPLIQTANTSVSVKGSETVTPTSGSPRTSTFGDFIRVRETGSNVNLVGGLLRDSGSKFDLDGRFVSVQDGATLTTTTDLPLMEFNDSTVHTRSSIFRVASDSGPGSSVTLAGPVLTATNTEFNTGPFGANYLNVRDGATFTSTTALPLMQLSGSRITSAGHIARFARFFEPPVGSEGLVNVTLAGPVLSATDSTINGIYGLMSVGDGTTFRSTTNAPLIQLGGNLGTTVSLGGIDPDPASSTFGQPQFPSVFGVSHRSTVLPNAATSAEIAGPVLSATNSDITTSGRVIGIFGQVGANNTKASSTVSSTTLDPLVQLMGGSLTLAGTSTFTNTSGTSTSTTGNFLSMFSPDPAALASLTLAGPLLHASNTTISGQNTFLSIDRNAQVTSTGTDPAIQLGNTPLTAVGTRTFTPSGGGIASTFTFGNFLSVGSNVSMTLAGPLLIATDSPLQTGTTFLGLGGGVTLTSTDTAPLVQLTRSPLTAGAASFADFLMVPGAASMSLAGPLVSATQSDIQTSQTFVNIFGLMAASSSVSSVTLDPLVQLTGGTLTLAGTSPPFTSPAGTTTTTRGNFLQMWSPDSTALVSLTAAGALLRATNTEISAQNHFLNIGSNARLSSTGTTAAIQLTNSPLTVVETTTFTPTDGSPSVSTNGILLNIDGSNAAVTLAGALLAANDSALTLAGSLVHTANGGRLTSTTTDPLIKLTGGTHALGGAIGFTPPSLLDLNGVNLNVVTGLGTDEVLKTGGPIIELNGATPATGATVNLSETAAHAIKLDSALLAASAPIVNLINSTLNTSPTGAGAMHVYQSQVTSLGPVFALDKSTLNISNGPLLSLTGGSSMTVNGDFASLINGSKITVLNGPLISVDGVNARGTPSTLNVTGALVNFGGTGGNQVIINNAVAPTATLSGLPVSQTGAGSAIAIGPNPIKNPSLGTLSVTCPGDCSGSVIRASNGGKVTITAP